MLHLSNAPTSRYAQPDGAEICIKFASGFKQEIHSGGGGAAAGFGEHAPAIHVQDQFAIAMGSGDPWWRGADFEIGGDGI